MCDLMLPSISFWRSQTLWTCRLLLCLCVVLGAVTCEDEYPPYSFSQDPVGGSTVVEGGFKFLICKSSSFPSPEYHWLKDGIVITNTSQEFTLRLNSLTRAGVGQYRCVASNKLGAILSSAAEVEVAYMEGFDGAGQSFTMPVSEGGALVIPLPALNCFPTPSLTWKEGFRDMGPWGVKHKILLNGSLVLLDSERPASGATSRSYVVEAINGISGEVKIGPTYSVTVTNVPGLASRLPPTLVVPPDHKTVTEDSDRAEFECVFNARPVDQVQISWFRMHEDGSTTPIVATPTKYLISQFSRTLTIKGPKPTDNGVYQCEASLAGFTDTAVGSANLTVFTSPTFGSQLLPSELIRDFGQVVTMQCQAQGYPPPTVTWYYNAREIFKEHNSSSYTIHTNSSLTISQLDLEHAGMYQCFIRNEAGEASKSTWLKVNSSPPQMVTPPRNMTVVEGAEARMTCTTKGAPKPTVNWTRTTLSGVESVVESGRIRILENGELFFLSALSADSGQYTCNSSNSKGHITASATLNVFIKTEISRPPQNKQVVKGATATFECGVSHDPGITVTWQWVFQSYQSGPEVIDNDMLTTVFDNGTLQLRSCGSSNIGQYTCSISSEGGNDSRTVSLEVIELPGPPVIQTVMLHPTDVRGVVVTWNPGYDGSTPIMGFSIQYRETISEAGNGDNAVWVTNSLDIAADARSTVVTGLKPARFYQFRVLAINRVGEGGPSQPMPVVPIEMPQQPPSAAPKGFFGVPATNRSVRLGWQPPDETFRNGPLLGYAIRYKPANYPDTSIQEVMVTNGTNLLVNPRYELIGLDYFTEYQIKIAAFNAKGVGVFSDYINVWTLEGHPTEAPKSLESTSVNSTSIRLSWLPPSPQFIHGVNLGYKVYGRRAGILQDDIEVQVNQDLSNPTERQTTILTGLRKYTEYSLTVLCFTTQGNGPKAPPINQRTAEDVPSQVGSLTFTNIQHTSVKVTWTEPTELNGILVDYTIMHEVKNRSDTPQEVAHMPPDITSYTIFGLTSMTLYTVHIFASTQVGPGPMRSADIRSGVPPSGPKPPVSLAFSNIEARSVLLQFYMPPDHYGDTSITLWKVEALEGTGATVPTTIYEVSDPTATSISVQNLRPYTYYQLRIIAVNIVGPSAPSLWTRSFQTLQDIPSAPPGSVTVRALNATALRVSWTPLGTNDWNGLPKGYKLYYKQENETDFTVEDLTNGMNMDSVILGRLQEWMVYRVKMLAYNDAGDSDFSPVTVERTRESVPSSGPANVVAVALSSMSINVTWGDVPMLDQNGLIQGFKVEFSSAEANINGQFLDVPGDRRSALIENLRKYVEYRIRVLAYTRMGDGVLSPPAVIKTLADVPGPPVRVWFPEVGLTFATIEWAEPNEPNGIITNYMVSYRLKGSNVPFINSTVLPPNMLSYQVTGLDKQAYYTFRVRAKTHFDQQYNGWGATATVEVLTMTNRSAPNSPGKPSIVQSQVKARSITISWVPAPFNGYGPLRNFTVQYQKTGQAWTDVQDTIVPTETIYSVKGLRPSTVYVFRIAATNDEGMSGYSVQSDAQKTLEDYPEGAPLNVDVERLTTTSVKVIWEQPLPSTWNGQLLGYKISYRQAVNTNYLEEIVPVSEERSRTFTGLVKFVNYEFLVNAFNSVGPGPTSTPVTVFVGEAAPTAPPVNINATAVNSSEIIVTWRPPPPETQNGDLSGYKITYWLASAMSQTAKQMIVRESPALLSGLKIYVEYSITVQAYNLAGEGPRSLVKNAKTLEGLPEAPAAITFWNVTYISLDIQWYPPPSPNGKIVNYTLTYMESSINGGTKLVTFNVPGDQTRKTIEELVPLSTYNFTVSARTSVGQGNLTPSLVTTGPQPGSPGRPRSLTVDRDAKDQKVILSWKTDVGDSGDYAIYTHFIQANNSESTRGWEQILQVFGSETRAEISLLELKPDAEYRLRVMSMNVKGISPYSDPSAPFRTSAPAVVEDEKPFHYQPWFLVIVGLICIIILLIVGSLLCLISRKGKPRPKKNGPTASTTNLTPTPEPEDGGFGNFEMTRQSTNRRNKFAGIRNGTANSIYARPPPRPSPASVAYSDDDGDDGASAAKPPLPDDDDDDDSSSCTDKPSQLDSSNPSDESDSDDSIDPPLPPPPPPSSPPPPPFSSAAHSYNAEQVPGNSWQNQNNNSSFNAYQYTDSEAESSHYAYSLNGGQILLNNTAGSRAPLPGFSSFV